MLHRGSEDGHGGAGQHRGAGEARHSAVLRRQFHPCDGGQGAGSACAQVRQQVVERAGCHEIIAPVEQEELAFVNQRRLDVQGPIGQPGEGFWQAANRDKRSILKKSGIFHQAISHRKISPTTMR